LRGGHITGLTEKRSLTVLLCPVYAPCRDNYMYFLLYNFQSGIGILTVISKRDCLVRIWQCKQCEWSLSTPHITGYI